MNTVENNEVAYKPIREFFIAGVQFHAMNKVLDELKVDDRFVLVLEPTNPYDSNAVRIEYSGNDGQVMCGYVPKKFSSEISAAFEVGKRLECVLVELNVSAKPWERAKVEIREVENA